MQRFELKGHESSLLPEGNWKLVWNDEFDGTELDRTKWDYRMSMMGMSWPAWTDEGVHLDGNGNAVFTMTMKDGSPVSSQLQTGYNFMDQPIEKTVFGHDHLQWNIGKLRENKYTHSHGYYECRCRLQQKEGWWSAFWLQSPVIGASLDPDDTGVEIDIMESFYPGEVHRHNVFTGGYGLDMQRRAVGGGYEVENKEEFHTFGLLWDETGYTYFVDGKEDGKITDFTSRRPNFILISTEVKGYRYENHQPVKEAFDNVGDTFVVDYVRVFEEVK